jgi:hypothetical protein
MQLVQLEISVDKELSQVIMRTFTCRGFQFAVSSVEAAAISLVWMFVQVSPRQLLQAVTHVNPCFLLEHNAKEQFATHNIEYVIGSNGAIESSWFESILR